MHYLRSEFLWGENPEPTSDSTNGLGDLKVTASLTANSHDCVRESCYFYVYVLSTVNGKRGTQWWRG